VFCVDVGDIFMVASDEYVAATDDIVKESAGFVSC